VGPGNQPFRDETRDDRVHHTIVPPMLSELAR
jgi:hypothetical protein